MVACALCDQRRFIKAASCLLIKERFVTDRCGYPSPPHSLSVQVPSFLGGWVRFHRLLLVSGEGLIMLFSRDQGVFKFSSWRRPGNGSLVATALLRSTYPKHASGPRHLLLHEAERPALSA